MNKVNPVGVGTRVLNFCVDTVMVFAIAFGLNKIWDFYVAYWNYPAVQFYVIMAVVSIVYYTLFELISGRTLGKIVTISKVVNEQGGRTNVGQILIRSVVRLFPLDFITIPFLNVTIHDYLSKTRVVEKRYFLPQKSSQ